MIERTQILTAQGWNVEGAQSRVTLVDLQERKDEVRDDSMSPHKNSSLFLFVIFGTLLKKIRSSQRVGD